MKEPGLDQRHRDKDGEIEKKKGNTLIKTLRKTYGEEFADGYRRDKKLENLLRDENVTSLSEFLKKSK